MAYSPTNWTNFPSTATPVNASNLNKIENELVALDTGKADESAVTTALAGKVDKVEGKGLSENDFTDTLKDKLDGISAQANKVEITPVVTEGTTLATISIDGVDTAIKGSDIDVDDKMSPTSENPVQNKVIYDALNNILPEETAEGNPISITDASGLNAKSCEVTFSPIQSGSGDPSPTNIRPISGRDSLVLNQCGKNLFNKNGHDTNKGYIAEKYLTNSGNVWDNANWFISEYIQIKGSVLTISGLPSSDANAPAYHFYDSEKTFISGASYGNQETKANITIPTNAEYLRISCLNNSTTVQVELSSTATAYEPYVTLSEHTATFPDTIYGGKYEFVEGGLQNTWSDKVDLGKLNWTYMSNYSIFTAYIPPAKQNAGCVCDSYAYSGASVGATRPDKTINVGLQYFSSSFNVVSVKDTSYTSAEDFKTAMNGVYVCYELATPQEITLTPETIALLKGNNVLFTDGDNITLKYSADIKEWVLAQLQS